MTREQESARKVCSPNRDLYQLQSAMTRGGRVPTIGYTLEGSAHADSLCDQMLVAKNLSFHAASLAFMLVA